MSSARTTVWIVGDQLNPAISSLQGLDPASCSVFMAESRARAARRPYHKQKIAFVWSAMRHFADELRRAGFRVDYHERAESYGTALDAHLAAHRPETIRLMETAEFGASHRLADLCRSRAVEVEVTPNNQFISDRRQFREWAEGRKQLRMENFYREMRRQTGILMEGDEPLGGQWNYDKRNRQTPPSEHRFPSVPAPRRDEISERVIETVRSTFPEHFGELDGFWLPVTRKQAESFARRFFDERLDLFGPYQDAIVTEERTLYHSLLSSALNVGLLDPLRLCRAAEKRYRDGKARIESVEGFVRQILGWREFVYQLYHSKMPGYEDNNFFGADLPLPAFYWDAETNMTCVANAVQAVIERGHNHHIQRLMVTGNFALIAGIEPRQVNDWYREVYTDAYDWVVAPNVLGMALFADGGSFASKPYAAAANYINKMSDCCAGCSYDAKDSTGERSCPFNALYWDFIDRNENELANNPRMSLIRKNWKKREPAAKRAIRARASVLRDRLRKGERL